MKSELAGIISRLLAMQDGNGEIKTRHFEKNGEDLAKVIYAGVTTDHTEHYFYWG